VRILKDVGVSKTTIRNALFAIDERADVLESLAMDGKLKAITDGSAQAKQ
jgi:hypothetical protein